MKRSVFSGLIITAALMASPVFAAEDLCDVNLQKIENAKTTTLNLGEPAKGQLEEATNQAKAAKASGDEKGCIAASTNALKVIEDVSKSKNQ
jgi:hypothetical protein